MAQLSPLSATARPPNRQSVAAKLKAAQAGTSSTVFDWSVYIIRDHGKSSYEAQDQIELELL